MTNTTAAKREIQKLQRTIVDALESVKAQDIGVFDTEQLSPLFERVIIASGTSNRQTKALAASVRDALRAAGFGKPSVEGETNGEWVIVDCGRAVVHIMQPSFRQYYKLEELWGERPVRLKFGAAKPSLPMLVKVAMPAKPSATLKRSSAAKKGVTEAFPSRTQAKRKLLASAGKPVAGKTLTKKVAVKKTAIKTLVKNAVAGKAAAHKT